MKINKSTLPQHSLLANTPCDYSDSFEGILTSKNQIHSIDLGKSFFSSAPKWVDYLFELRNKIVSLIGLKTSVKSKNRQEQLSEFNCLPGERLGLFKVFERNTDEVILGEDDKHLNFRISLFLESNSLRPNEYKITITTTVLLHNKFGKLYFAIIRPFHQMIVPEMLKGIIKNLSAKN
jgi:Protein of unknown function (DUF2867)